jgi:uracil phosphoribosyltransferase
LIFLNMSLQLRVYVPDHPLIKHWLAIARDRNTPASLFKTAMTELGRWLTFEAIGRWLPTVQTELETPLSLSEATLIDPRIKPVIIPILRAGLTLLEGVQAVVPFSNASIYHLGLVRDEQTLECSCYLNKLPDQFEPECHILILEPMLATGSSLVYCLQEICKRGGQVENIRVISIIAAHQALQKLAKEYPNLQIHLAMIDPELNKNGYIVPGLGDAGDRAFGT